MSLKWSLRPRLVALNSGTPVLAALVRRLTPDEAKDLIAQLPSLLQPRLRAVRRRLPRSFWRSSEPRSPRASAPVR
jgi:uncharacterized protein (DUF2267 family)